MSPVAVATAVAAVVAVGAIVWTLYVLFDIGSDGLGAGPWRRPQPYQTHTRLPADFVGLWALFGSRSINGLAGSRESAVRRLARLEAVLRGQAPADAEPSPEIINALVQGASFDQGWLERRVDQLEILAGLQPNPGPAPGQPIPSRTQPSPARGRR